MATLPWRKGDAMRVVDQALKASGAASAVWAAGMGTQAGSGAALAAVLGAERLVEEARWRLLRAGRGSARAAADLRALKAPLVYAAGKGNAYACEILAAMSSSGVGGMRE